MVFQPESSFFFAILGGFILCICFVYFILHNKKINVRRIDEKTLLLRLPVLGTVEADDQKVYQGVFVRDISETLEKMKIFQEFIDFNLMIQYAQDYNINYIGFEGDMGDRNDMGDGKWSNSRLAYNTLSKGYNGGYNIYLNPSLDRESVCSSLSKQLGVEIKPDELYTFLFLHEIGHTKKSGNESYVTALVNHSLSGGRRSAKRRRILKDLHLKVEKNADNFALQELLKLRKKGCN